jgi:hypothetical protein
MALIFGVYASGQNFRIKSKKLVTWQAIQARSPEKAERLLLTHQNLVKTVEMQRRHIQLLHARILELHQVECQPTK